MSSIVPYFYERSLNSVYNMLYLTAHPNTKFFITHGGLGSITEALFFGVPMVAVPFYGDQTQNVADAVRKGFAIQIKSTNITEDSLEKAFAEIIHNPR